eukprot:TRINITY_DN8268_c0_g1_i1.p1 TRINITY_DN8268_c0_g1~~TRINITY_DN8268_c0_g1_i1.p1  ORF type:complete len:118 (-),score=18.81 TRINITY_DN8268_c0_g1_i1:217-570(-)
MQERSLLSLIHFLMTSFALIVEARGVEEVIRDLEIKHVAGIENTSFYTGGKVRDEFEKLRNWILTSSQIDAWWMDNGLVQLGHQLLLELRMANIEATKKQSRFSLKKEMAAASQRIY